VRTDAETDPTDSDVMQVFRVPFRTRLHWVEVAEGETPILNGLEPGILSIIGFLPDTFSSTWFGSIMDAKTDAAGNVAAGAYQQIFWILIGSAVLAAISSGLTATRAKRRQSKRPCSFSHRP